MSGFDWKEYVDCADELVDTPFQDISPEAHWRIAAGRAYYGAFCVVRNVLKDEGNHIPESGKAHGKVRELLNNSGDSERRRAGKYLGRLHGKRKEADYNDVLSTQRPPAIRRKAKAAVANAREVIRIMEP
jgi:hypothetical protein